MKPNIIMMIASLVTAQALGQTVHKCPDPSGTVKIQQMPCSPTGGGETITVNPPKPSDDSADTSPAQRRHTKKFHPQE